MSGTTSPRMAEPGIFRTSGAQVVLYKHSPTLPHSMSILTCHLRSSFQLSKPKFRFSIPMAFFHNHTRQTQPPSMAEQKKSLRRRCSLMLKQQKTRLYIFGRCITMLLCWQEHAISDQKRFDCIWTVQKSKLDFINSWVTEDLQLVRMEDNRRRRPF